MKRIWGALRWDGLACLILVVLWAGFFWRFLTPVAADQVSLVEGDFSGQFVAFGAYQAERLWAGEVPLWNPYNNGGLPFLADTQSAVFYPPRLITVALTGLTRQWTYHALELEMMAHVLLTSFLMYALVRRLTLGEQGSIIGALVGALTWAYGGFMTGYPPLQLALLEAVSWGPLLLLALHEASATGQIVWPWLLVGGVALGLSALAGHPQSVWFLGLLFVAFWGYRVWRMGWRWPRFVTGAALVGGLGILLALVQLLPAAEYLQHTTRIGFGFEAKRSGFPIQDIIQIVFPRVISVWSPLYVGIAGLVLAIVAIWRRARDWAFWSGAALVGLLFSLGGNAALYGLLYNVLPGATLFRGQERGAIVVALAVSILAGLGVPRLLALGRGQERILRRGMLALVVLTTFVVLVAFVLWLGPANMFYSDKLSALTFSALLAGLIFGVATMLVRQPTNRWWLAALVALIIFDLFTVAGDNLLTEPVPPGQRLVRPAIVDVALADPALPAARVDGIRAVMGNFGSMWHVPDIRGISPLWLQGPYALVGQDFPNPLAWELFAVRYVFTDWAELPVPGDIVATGEDPYGPVNLHLLADPRPFALLMGDVWPVDSDDYAYAVLADPAVDVRQTVVLDVQAEVMVLPEELSAEGTAGVSTFAPERIVIDLEGVETASVLSVALPHYPGWHAMVDGVDVPVLRAYGALSAVLVPAGAHQVVLVYAPWTFAVGALVSALSWAVTLILIVGSTAVLRRR